MPMDDPRDSQARRKSRCRAVRSPLSFVVRPPLFVARVAVEICFAAETKRWKVRDGSDTRDKCISDETMMHSLKTKLISIGVAS